jgi:hypothetical protein
VSKLQLKLIDVLIRETPLTAWEVTLYMSLKIRDGLVEVDSKPYSVVELYVGGLLRGELTMSKSNGMWGEIAVKSTSAVTYEYPGILVVGEWSGSSEFRVDVTERRRSLAVKYSSTMWSVPEVKLIIEGVESRLIAAFTPRRLTFQCSGGVEVSEEPFRLVLRARSLK